MKYTVQIQATITKWIDVDADNADQAAELAHEYFDVHNDDSRERYDQETISVEKAK